MRARRLRAAGRGGRSALAARILPAGPERGAPGAAPGGSRRRSHRGPRAPGPPLLRPPARPPFCRRRPAELPACRSRGARGLPGPGLARASERRRPADSVRACPPARPPVCASVCLCERLRLPGKAAPAGSPGAPSRAPASPPHGDWRPAAPGPVRAPGLVQGRGIPGSRSEGGGGGGGEVGEWRGGSRERPGSGLENVI